MGGFEGRRIGMTIGVGANNAFRFGDVGRGTSMVSDDCLRNRAYSLAVTTQAKAVAISGLNRMA